MSYYQMTDRDEIEQLFRAHYKPLRRMASAILHDDDAARDVVHDVFAQILFKRCKASGDGDFGRVLFQRNTAVTPGYLVTAVRNRCINRLRDLDTRTRIAKLYFLETDDYDSEEWLDEATIARISEIIRTDLTRQCREVMEMRFGRGLKFAEIAEALDVSEKTVYKHVRQALVIIRKKLDENG